MSILLGQSLCPVFKLLHIFPINQRQVFPSFISNNRPDSPVNSVLFSQQGDTRFDSQLLHKYNWASTLLPLLDIFSTKCIRRLNILQDIENVLNHFKLIIQVVGSPEPSAYEAWELTKYWKKSNKVWCLFDVLPKKTKPPLLILKRKSSACVL